MQDIAFVPTTNLSESKHASWLASVGNKQMLNVYDACVSDLANALLQSAKMLSYVDGKYKGTGPSAEKLAKRVTSGGQTPARVNSEIENTIHGTPMYRRQHIEGDNVTVSKKRKSIGIILEEEVNASHRPEYVTHNQPRKKSQIPREETEPEEDLLIDETELHKSMWAIRRIPKGSRVQCQGYLGNHSGKCKKNIKNTGIGTVAPSFWGIRTWENCTTNAGRGTKAQFMWFCNDNIDHTWQICNTITHSPLRVPVIWPVDKGTNLTNTEIMTLERGGYKLAKKIAMTTGNTRYRPGVSEAAAKRIDSAISMQATIQGYEVMKEGKHEKFMVSTSASQVRNEVYEVHIAMAPMCTCKDFAERAAQGRPYLACKHIYFIFLRYFGLDVNHNMFIHQSRLSELDLGRVFNARRTM